MKSILDYFLMLSSAQIVSVFVRFWPLAMMIKLPFMLDFTNHMFSPKFLLLEKGKSEKKKKDVIMTNNVICDQF